MACSERIVNTFTAFWEPADAAIFAVGMKNTAAACEYFMPVCLVAYVPNKLVIRRIEYIMQGNSKFHNAEAGAKVAAMYAHAVNDKLSQFITNLFKLVL